MKNETCKKAEYRYFEMSANSYVIGLLNIGKWRRSYGKDDHAHMHNYMEIGYCHQGGGRIAIGDRSYRYEKGALCILPPSQPHVTIYEGKGNSWEYLVIDVEGFLNHVLGPDRRGFAGRTAEEIYKKEWILEQKDCGELGAMVKELLKELGNRGEYSEEYVRGCLLALLMEIARMNLGQGSPENRRRELLSPALAYIRKNYRQDIRIEDLAKLCCISETHFRRLFGTVMDTSPVRYINLVRISTACELLKRTDFAIREIGVMTGYPTLSTFQRNFKAMTGIQPGIWRKHQEPCSQRRVPVYGPGELSVSCEWSKLHGLRAKLKTQQSS